MLMGRPCNGFEICGHLDRNRSPTGWQSVEKPAGNHLRTTAYGTTFRTAATLASIAADPSPESAPRSLREAVNPAAAGREGNGSRVGTISRNMGKSGTGSVLSVPQPHGG